MAEIATVMMLARIIQGEAGGMGVAGMCAVAMSMHTRMWEYQHSPERIREEYYGWWDGEVNPVAVHLAQMVLDKKFPDDMDLYWCMGGDCDVAANNWRNGDYYIVDNNTGDSIHLYHYRNIPWKTRKDEEE